MYLANGVCNGHVPGRAGVILETSLCAEATHRARQGWLSLPLPPSSSFRRPSALDLATPDAVDSGGSTISISSSRQTMGWYDGGDELLQEERSVRLGENALVAGIAFILFWANFGLSWRLSSRRVPEFSGFTSGQEADWCSR
jgi:hypothetical protein